MKALPGSLLSTFATKAARLAGVHLRDLYVWRDDGAVMELSRGVFRRADAAAASHLDLLAAASRVTRAIVCCVSAAVHDLTDELVASVQIAVPKRDRVPKIDYPPTVAFRFDEATFELGLSAVEAAPGERVRVYDPARTVVDLMRLRHQFGEPAAHSALHRYLVAGCEACPAAGVCGGAGRVWADEIG